MDDPRWELNIEVQTTACLILSRLADHWVPYTFLNMGLSMETNPAERPDKEGLPTGQDFWAEHERSRALPVVQGIVIVLMLQFQHLLA